MPAVHEVELDRDGVALAERGHLVVQLAHRLPPRRATDDDAPDPGSATGRSETIEHAEHTGKEKGRSPSASRMESARGTHLERVQAPGEAVAHEAEDRADVVAEDDAHEERGVHEARAREELVVLRGARCGRERVRGGEGAALVQREDALRYVLRRGGGAEGEVQRTDRARGRETRHRG